jgi:hypothetical protein
MYSDLSLKFEHNNLFRIVQDNSRVCIKTNATIHNIHIKETKKYIDLILNENTFQELCMIEQTIQNKYPNRTFKSNIQNKIIHDVKIPCRYGHVDISMKTRNDKTLLFEHLEKDLLVHVHISPSFLWIHESTYGITWVVSHIVANIIYE